MKNKSQIVELSILGRTYPVKIGEGQRSELMAIEKEIQNQLNQYKIRYENIDHQDCLSMALIETRVDGTKSIDPDEQVMITDLRRIEALLDASLSA